MPEIENVYDTWAPQLIAKGLHPLPIGPGTKKPMILKNGVFVGLPLWTQRGPITTPQPGAGIGLLMGRNISAVDIDDDGKIGIAILNVLPETLCRKTGQRGETLLYFAPGLPSKKYKINGKCVVEILGVGTQSVLPPSVHPDTRQPYRYTGSKTLDDIQKASDLPFLFKDAIEALERVLSTFGWAPEPEQHNGGNGSATAGSAVADSPFRALNNLALKNPALWVPALGLHGCRRRVGRHATYEAVAHWRPSTKGHALADRGRNLKISPLGIEDFGDGRKYTPIDLVVAARGCALKEAVAYLDDKLGWSAGGPEIKVDPKTSSAKAEHAQQSKDDADADATKDKAKDKAKADGDGKRPPWPTPYANRAAPQIPLRKFAMGQHYIIGACTITASAGGVGKSTLSLLDAVSFTIGRNLLTGEILEKRRRVWVWNAEDDVDEMERRVVAICMHYGINREDLVGWLFLDSGYDLPLELAHGNGKGPVVQDKLLELIAARVKRQDIEVVMLDPLVALHSMSEGDNPGHAKLIRALATKVAKPCNCAVDINAHTRKPGPGQDSMTVDDVRGAGALIYSARSGRMLHTMGLAEAEKCGVEAEERLSYYRLERAKANMAKRGTICWVHMIEVPIPNKPDGSYGDTIAVPIIWAPPDAMASITDTIATAIAGEIAKGKYKRGARAGSSWAGRLVGLRCGIDIETKAGKARAKLILETLIKTGVLAVEIRVDENRNASEYVVPGPLAKGPFGRGRP